MNWEYSTTIGTALALIAGLGLLLHMIGRRSDSNFKAMELEAREKVKREKQALDPFLEARQYIQTLEDPAALNLILAAVKLDIAAARYADLENGGQRTAYTWETLVKLAEARLTELQAIELQRYKDNDR